MPKNKKIIPASSQELANIKFLKEEILNLKKEVNRPYLILFSLALVYLLIEVIHKHEWSPFPSDTYLNQIDQSPEAFAKVSPENQIRLLDDLKQILKSISQTKEFSKEYGILNNGDLVLENVDSFILNYPQFKSLVLPIKRRLSESMQPLFIKLLSDMKMEPKDFARQTGFLFGKVLSQEFQGQLPLNTLFRYFQFIRTAIEKYKEDSQKDQIKYAVLSHFIKIGMRDTKILWSVVASFFSIFLAHWIYRFQEIGSRNIASKEILTHRDAQAIISDLEKQRDCLLLPAQRNIKIARVGSIILFAFGYFFYNQMMSYFPEITAIAISLAVAASFNLYTEIQNGRQYAKLKWNKPIAEYNLQHNLKQFNTQIGLEEKDTLDSSYAILTFDKYKEPSAPAYTALSAKAMAKEFYRCCFFYKLSLIAQEDESMSLPLSAALERKKLQLVRDLFVASINRLAQIKIAERQLYNLSRKYPELNISSFIAYDDSQLSELAVRFSFNDDLPINIREKIFATLKKAGHQLNETESLSEICLTIHKPFSENILGELGENLIRTSPGQKTQAFPSPKMSASSEIYHPRKQKALKQKSSRFLNFFRRGQNGDQDTRKISWPSAKYDGQHPNNKVYPLLLGNVHSEAHYQNTHSFVFNALQRKDIPLSGEDGDRLYEAVKSLTERARFVPTFGFQGFVPGQGGVKPDMHGEPFKVKGKGKLLGIFGDARVFLKDELDETGKFTLKVVAAIELKAHKTEQRR